MNYNLNLHGGKRYGKGGSKGYLIDIFQPEAKPPISQHKLKSFFGKKEDKEYFTVDKGKTQYFNLKIDNNDVKEEETTLNEINILQTNLKEYLIKVYFKTKYYQDEKKLTIQLINNEFSKDFITYNENKIIGLKKIIKTMGIQITIYGLFKKKM